MKREFNVIIEKDADGFFVGTVPELQRLPYSGEVLGYAHEKSPRSHRTLP